MGVYDKTNILKVAAGRPDVAQASRDVMNALGMYAQHDKAILPDREDWADMMPEERIMALADWLRAECLALLDEGTLVPSPPIGGDVYAKQND